MTIYVGRHGARTIIDSGANINYANRKWCKKANIRTRRIAIRKIRAYDGTYIDEDIHEATISFRIGEQRHRQKFFVLG